MKSFSAIYNSGNDSIALEQKVFVKLEPSRGTLTIPAATDFIYHVAGGSVEFTQPVESSPHKSGRHHTSIIKSKTSTSWTLPMFFNIDETLGSPGVAEIDAAARVLYKSLFGKEDISGGSPVYTTEEDPSITFSIFENGDHWAQQVPGAFVDTGNLTLPGDGQAQIEFAGMAKTAMLVGIGKSVINNTANTVTLATGEGKKFPVGSKVMLIEADGTTRSADTPAGSARNVTAVSGDVVTVDGAVLADADGSTNPIYLTYFEPVGPFTAINNPVTGLQGSVEIVGLGTPVGCVRSLGLSMANNHEPQDFCYGEEGLGGQLFTPGGRFTAEISMELNLGPKLVAFINSVKEFEAKDITAYLGDSAGRHMKVEIPNAIFSIPAVSVPESGTIPVSFTGNAYQTALDAADEVTLSFL
jgi:RNase P/RNase MRP subunit p29